MQSRDRFDKFTERARRVMHLAQEEAQRLQNTYIGVEHLWLGIMCEGEGVGAKVLERQGVTLQKMRDAVAATQSSSKQSSQDNLGLTTAARKAIELAVDEARHLSHHYIGTEHLLLGLAHQADKTSQELFATLGVKLADLSSQTIQILSSAGVTQQSGPAPRTQGGTQKRDKFSSFSPRARKTLAFAQEEAQRLRHGYIGTEHLLLGLLRQIDGLAYQILSSFGVTLNQARNALELIVGQGDRIVLGEMSTTPQMKHSLDLAVQEADLLESENIETEHLLLALLHENESVALAILERLGVNRAKIYVQTLYMLRDDIAQKAARSPIDRGETGQARQAQMAPESESLPAPSDEDGATAARLIQQLNDQGHGADRLNEEAKSALTFALQEAQRFQHNYIGTEHLLLGVLRTEGSIATRALAHLGIHLAKVRSSVEFIIGRGDRILLGQIDLTPRAKKVVALAEDEAQRLQHDYIGAEHLLLALVREGEGIAAGVLESLGVTLPAVRRQVMQLIERDQERGQQG